MQLRPQLLRQQGPRLGQQRRANSSSSSAACASWRGQGPTRQPKSFADMEQARQALHAEARRAGGGAWWTLGGALSGLSAAAFGSAAAGLAGAVYRRLLAWGGGAAAAAEARAERAARRRREAAAAAAAAAPGAVADLSAVLLVSQHRVVRLAERFPALLSMPPARVAERVLLLKRLCPGADAARLVEVQPAALLGAEPAALERARAHVEALADGLPGADVAEIYQADPRLLFLDPGPSLSRLHELWPPALRDACALKASDPQELALALWALSDAGPPPRF